MAYAVAGAAEGLFAPYKVATWADIPAGAKEKTGLWFMDYGGVIAIARYPSEVGYIPYGAGKNAWAAFLGPRLTRN